MVRKTPYVPWASRHCKTLREHWKPVRDLEWREPTTTVTLSLGNKQTKTEVRENNAETWQGRPHQEEAMMIYRRGTEKEGDERCEKCRNGQGKFEKCVVMSEYHHGSCANCVFQSSTNGCLCAAANIAAEAARKQQVLAAKAAQKAARGKASSKKRKISLVADGDELPLKLNDDGDRARDQQHVTPAEESPRHYVSSTTHINIRRDVIFHRPIAKPPVSTTE